jgi:hypothetical protein
MKTLYVSRAKLIKMDMLAAMKYAPVSLGEPQSTQSILKLLNREVKYMLAPVSPRDGLRAMRELEKDGLVQVNRRYSANNYITWNLAP